MILYEKRFPLGSGVSFLHYIKSLNEMNFSPYTLLISEIPNTKDFHIEVVITNFMNLWGLHNVFHGGILFSELTVKHSKGDGSFIIQGAIKTRNLLITLFYIALSLFLFLLLLSSMFTKGGFSWGNFLIYSCVCLLIMTPVISTYFREKKLLDKIGSVASELKRK